MDSYCPCCDDKLLQTEICFKIEDIFQNWTQSGVIFSEKTYAEYLNISELVLYRCQKCGFGIYIPTLQGPSSFYKDITQQEYYLQERWDLNLSAKKIISNKNISSLLDIGCGYGAFLHKIIQKRPDIACHGFDPNPSVSGKMSNKIYFLNDLKKDSLGVDVVTAFQVLEHDSDPTSFIKVIREKLNKNGLLFLSVPNYDGPIRHFYWSHTEVPPHHVTQWTHCSINLFLEKNGFKVFSIQDEFLPSYLFESYIDVVASDLFNKNKKISNFISKNKNILLKLLNFFRVKYIPTTGHTLLVQAYKI